MTKAQETYQELYKEAGAPLNLNKSIVKVKKDDPDAKSLVKYYKDQGFVAITPLEYKNLQREELAKLQMRVAGQSAIPAAAAFGLAGGLIAGPVGALLGGGAGLLAGTSRIRKNMLYSNIAEDTINNTPALDTSIYLYKPTGY